MNPLFTAIYVIGFGGLLAAEIIGIRRKASGDTITEHWRWIDRHAHGPAQWFFRAFTAGLLVWTLFHLAGPWA